MLVLLIVKKTGADRALKAVLVRFKLFVKIWVYTMANESVIIEKSLSQEFRDFLYSRRMAIKNPASYLDSYKKISLIDCHIQPEIKKVTTLYQILMFLLIFAVFFTFFAFFLTISVFDNSDNFITAIIFDTVLLLYYYFLFKTGSRKKELKNKSMGSRLTNGVIPVLSVLKEEFDTNPESEMTIDLSPVEDKLNKISQIKYLNGKEQTYSKTWFVFTSPLQTGGNIRITIVDAFRLRTYTKTSSCGNIKSKRKEKNTHYVKVELYLPENQASVHKPDQKYPDFKVKLMNEKNKSAVAVVGKFVNADPLTNIVLPSAVFTTMVKAFKCYRPA